MFLRYLAPLALLLGSGLAAAADPIYCVNSTVELQTALDLSSGDGIDNQIRIRGGIFATPADQPFRITVNDGRNLSVSGGWSNSNCTQQVQNAAATTLRGDAVAVRRVLEMTGSSNAQTTTSLVNLTLEDGDTPVGQNGGCLWMSSNAAELRVERVILQNCVATVGDGGGLYVTGPRISLLGNLVIDSEAKRGALFVQLLPNGRAYLNNNTVTGNRAVGQANQSGGAHLAAEAGAEIRLANNIFWGNTVGSNRYDLLVEYGTVYSGSTHVGVFVGSFAQPSSSTSGGDPNFIAGSSLPLLGPISVCRDNGNPGPSGGVPAVDLLGAPRVQGFSIDRGAFEASPVDALFADGFES